MFKRFLKTILLLLFIFSSNQSNAQIFGKKEKILFSRTAALDSLMQNNDVGLLNLLSHQVSFGHSNGWVQNYQDFTQDFASGKVKYTLVRQTKLSEIKFFKKTCSIRRTVKVSGKYQNENFTLNLSLLEVWIKDNAVWQLWSRQSVSIK